MASPGIQVAAFSAPLGFRRLCLWTRTLTQDVGLLHSASNHWQ